jgi:hypothetical protein
MVTIPLFGFAQVGFLGKRVHFQIENKFSPAWSNLNFNHKQGVFRFNYHLMPSVEYVFADKWSISANYQIFETAFRTDDWDNYYASKGNEKRYYGYEDGYMITHGCGINFSLYFGDAAPAGYYIKFGADAFFYNVSVHYTAYDTLVRISYKDEYIFHNEPGNYTNRDWAMGVRFEIGRNFFIGRYLSLGTSLSCGLLCKGWGNLMYNSNPQFIDAASKRLLTSYIGGISIKIGVLPF